MGSVALSIQFLLRVITAVIFAATLVGLISRSLRSLRFHFFQASHYVSAAQARMHWEMASRAALSRYMRVRENVGLPACVLREFLP